MGQADFVQSVFSAAVDGADGEEPDSGAAKRAAEKLRANRDVNLFTPVLLNACHKRDAGQALTDLEQRLVEVLDVAGYSDADIADVGRVYAGLSQKHRKNLFPKAV